MVAGANYPRRGAWLEVGKTRSQFATENIVLLAREIKRLRTIEKCETDLRTFVKESWHIVEPGTTYLSNWSSDAICDHLQAVADGHIQNLIINISPRCSKSTKVSVQFPAWNWIRRPEKKSIYSSYDLKLAHRDSRKTNSLIKSDWYQKNWADRFRILTGKGGQDGKTRFDNDKGGFRFCTSTTAGTTGEGGDFIVYDDPNDVGEMNSDAHIEAVIYFHEMVMGSRLNDPKTGARICIQQRCGERDLTGHILATEKGWEHLVIPMEYEEKRRPTSIGWEDPRTEPGELMWPDRFPKEVIDGFKIKPVLWAGQYQQRPAPAEGDLFKRQWFNYWNPQDAANLNPIMIRVPGEKPIEKLPVYLPVAFEQVLHSYDMAFKDEKHNDLVAGQVWGRVGANFYLLHRDTGHKNFPASLKLVRDFSARFPCPEKLVEDKANGPAVIATLRNEIPGLIAINPEGGKIARANAVAPYVESGNVYLPNPDMYSWVREFIEELANFPRGTHDDDVDAMTQALRRMSEAMSTSSLPEFRVMPRVSEPDSACHVKPDHEMATEINPQWRRWIAISPGPNGAALWVAETPTQSLRVYRELSLAGLDAHEAGRQVAEATLPDIRGYLRMLHASAKWNIDLLMDKECFKPVEPIGCYADLFEQGLLSYESPSASFDERQRALSELRQAKFSSQMVALDETVFEHLRDMLRFKPIDFEEVSYDRKKAFALAEQDISLYNKYMAAVDGKVYGEYPRIKFAASCKQTIAAMGAARREQDVVDSFLTALLLGISAPPSLMSKKPVKEIPWKPGMQSKGIRAQLAGMAR